MTLSMKRTAVVTALGGLLQNPDFANLLPGLLAEPQRAGLVMQRLKSLSS